MAYVMMMVHAGLAGRSLKSCTHITTSSAVGESAVLVATVLEAALREQPYHRRHCSGRQGWR